MRDVAKPLLTLLVCGLVFTSSICVVAREAVPLAEDPVVEARMLAISEELRCLVCQNETIASSHAELADDLRREMRTLIRQGKTDAEIMDFMVERYGDFVRYRPPLKSTTWLLWFGPFMLLGGAVVTLLVYLRRCETLPSAPELSAGDRKKRPKFLVEPEGRSKKIVMVTFWIVASVLMALILMLLCRPLLRQHTTGNIVSQQALNNAIYRDQLQELVRDRQSGALSEADYATSREDLERLALDNAAADNAPDISSARAGRSALFLLLALPLAAIAFYFQLGNPAGLTPMAHSAISGNESAPSNVSLEQAIATLTERLKKNPDNLDDWIALGRSYKLLGRYDDAEKCFAKASPVMDHDPALMLEQIDMALVQYRGNIPGKPLKLLADVLQQQPDNPQALMLAGAAAFMKHDFPGAIRYWENLLKQVPPQSPDAESLKQGIAKAHEMMGATDNASAMPNVRSGAIAGMPAAISGRVELSPQMKSLAAPNDTVFILARAVHGPRMPLAVLRTTVAQLPMHFTLDDSMALSPDNKLSAATEVRIEARVSKSGDAISKPGDLAGSSGPVKPGARQLGLLIDHVLP